MAAELKGSIAEAGAVRPKPWFRGPGPTAVGVVVGALLWQLIGVLHLTSVVPPLSAVLVGWVQLFRAGEVTEGLVTSVYEVGIGFTAAAVVGLGLGLLTGRSRVAEAMLEPYVDAFMSSPVSAYVPVLAMLFGVGATPVIITVFVFSVFVILVNVSAAIRDAPRSLQEMAVSLGASEVQLIRYIILPAALPLTLEGLRLGLTRAIKGLIIGEILIAIVGIGGRLATYGDEYEMVQMYALLLTVLALAMALDGLSRLLQRWLAPWHFAR